MSMTDPIADLLTRIRNGARARKEQVEVPWSRVKTRIVQLLIDEGFVKEYSVVEQAGHQIIRIWLKYDNQNHSAITEIHRVSRPSLRVYVGAQDIPPVRGGLGVNVLSTPVGLLSDRAARKQNVGGEILLAIW